MFVLLIDDGSNGYVVPIRDDEALANKCIEVINNENKSELFVRNGRKKLKEFDSGLIFDKWNKYLIGIAGK